MTNPYDPQNPPQQPDYTQIPQQPDYSQVPPQQPDYTQIPQQQPDYTQIPPQQPDYTQIPPQQQSAPDYTQAPQQPTYQQPFPAGPPVVAGQFAQPGQPQPGQPQPGQFPQGQVPQGQFPQGQFAAPAPQQPKKSSNVVWLSIMGLAVLCGVAAALLFMKPWGSGSSKATDYPLSEGITATISTPSGWRAEPFTDGGKDLVMLIQDGDSRTAKEIYESGNATDTKGELHGVLVGVNECESFERALNDEPTPGKWVVGDSTSEKESTSRQAALGVEGAGEQCLALIGVDANSASTPASDLVKQIADGGDSIISGTWKTGS